MRSEPRFLVIGAGPPGLSAAWRLHELGHTNWHLVEASALPGGLASSVIDDKGFTWDLGGHVLFSHYKYFDQLMATVVGDQWVEHIREAWVWMRERWIPYPFQNNIWRLPEDELIACLDGLLAIAGHTARRESLSSFREWLLPALRAGTLRHVHAAVNRKVWAYDPSKLGVGWMGERVATVDFARVLRNLVYRRDDVGWGPNSTFRFPLRGGTGAIWQAVSDRLPQERLQFDAPVRAVDIGTRTVTFIDGGEERYDHLISTMPLDLLLRVLSGAPSTLTNLADQFVHSSSHIVGIGLTGRPPGRRRRSAGCISPSRTYRFIARRSSATTHRTMWRIQARNGR